MRSLAVVCAIVGVVGLTACGEDGCPPGSVEFEGRCVAPDDAGADAPGADAPGGDDSCVATAEICDGIDNDCNGMTDEGADIADTCGALPAGATAWSCDGGCVIATCEDGLDDCNGDASDGCEARLDTAATCGSCDVGCGSGETCGDAASCTPAATHDWSGRFGVAGDDEVVSLTVGLPGNVYVGGNTDGAINLGGGAVTANGSRDGWAAQFSDDGSHVWSRSFGGPSDDTFEAVIVGRDEGPVIGFATGTFQSRIEGMDSVGRDDIWIGTFNETTAPTSLTVSGSAEDDRIGGFGRGEGAINVFGQAGGNLPEFDAESVAGPFLADIFESWFVQPFVTAEFLGSTSDAARAIAGGWFSGHTDFTGGFDADGRDGFVLGLRADGRERWFVQLSGPGDEAIEDVAFEAGTVFVVGQLEENAAATLGTLDLTPTSADALVIAALESDGTPRWARANVGAVSPTAIVAVADGFFVVGSFDRATDFGSGTITPAGQDGIVLRFDADGNLRWALPIAGSGDAEITTADVFVDGGSTYLYVGGWFDGEIELDGTHSSAGGRDAFLARFEVF